jgi:uncharacterized protein YueI
MKRFKSIEELVFKNKPSQFVTSYLLHIGAGNLNSVEMFAFLNGITLTPNQLRKYILSAIRKASKKQIVKRLNEHAL